MARTEYVNLDKLMGQKLSAIGIITSGVVALTIYTWEKVDDILAARRERQARESADSNSNS